MSRAYLTFSLYGPMAAWGEVAVGQERPATPQPSRSALLGLLAAALGLQREDPAQTALAEDYGTAVCVEAGGSSLRDYHTAQVPGSVALKRHPAHTRREEVLAGGGDLNTILSSREYSCDSFCRVAIWPRDGARWPLEELRDALERPVFPLYLGRKSCPLGLPLQASVQRAGDLASAFAQMPAIDARLAELGKLFEPVRQYFWDADGEPGDLPPAMVLRRRDQPLNRLRWHFEERDVHFARQARGTSATEG